MKSLKRMYISILSVIISFIVFGTVTYAFFGMALINNVDGLNFSASSGNELQMSLDGENFYTSLPNSELEKVFDNIALLDVTSTDGIDFYQGGLNRREAAIPNQDYISFDLWIRTSEAERYIYLINNISSEIEYDTERIGTYVISRGVPWIAKRGFLNGPFVTDWVEMGTLGIYHASESIRISIHEQQDDLNPLQTDERTELESFMFDPSGNPNRGYGKSYGQFSYFFETTRIWVDLPTLIPEVSYRLSDMDPNNPYQALDNESLVASLQPTGVLDDKDKEYYQGKIRINIWIEGWDADTFNSILGDQLRIQLQFKAARKAVN
jgi:hypothetical protein